MKVQVQERVCDTDIDKEVTGFKGIPDSLALLDAR
jgi:hypothetical protein